MKIICEPKKGMYGFIWRIVFEDDLYQLQRFSKEYNTWFSVNHHQTIDEPLRLYNQVES